MWLLWHDDMGTVEVHDAVAVNVLCSGSKGIDGKPSTFYFENAGDINVVSTGSYCMSYFDVTIVTTNDTSNPQQFDAKCSGTQSCQGMVVHAGESTTRYCSVMNDVHCFFAVFFRFVDDQFISEVQRNRGVRGTAILLFTECNVCSAL